jgi:hypothetical protein
MRKAAALLISILICATCMAGAFHHTGKEQTHEQWLADRIKEAKSVTVGMSRADLLKVFDRGGGFQVIPAETYVLRSCLLIKVNVNFDMSATDRHEPIPDKDLKIKTISEPYLGYVVLD